MTGWSRYCFLAQTSDTNISCLQCCCHAIGVQTSSKVACIKVQRVIVSVCMQAYVHELGQCLLKVEDDRHGLVTRRLLLLSVEGMRLIGRRLLYNPAAHKAVITANLVQGQPTLLHLDADFYTNLAVGSRCSVGEVPLTLHLKVDQLCFCTDVDKCSEGLCIANYVLSSFPFLTLSSLCNSDVLAIAKELVHSDYRESVNSPLNQCD